MLKFIVLSLSLLVFSCSSDGNLDSTSEETAYTFLDLDSVPLGLYYFGQKSQLYEIRPLGNRLVLRTLTISVNDITVSEEATIETIEEKLDQDKQQLWEVRINDRETSLIFVCPSLEDLQAIVDKTQIRTLRFPIDNFLPPNSDLREIMTQEPNTPNLEIICNMFGIYETKSVLIKKGTEFNLEELKEIGKNHTITVFGIESGKTFLNTKMHQFSPHSSTGARYLHGPMVYGSAILGMDNFGGAEFLHLTFFAQSKDEYYYLDAHDDYITEEWDKYFFAELEKVF
jgi:hypothetical protein